MNPCLCENECPYPWADAIVIYAIKMISFSVMA